jgi:hypothetical protein
VAAYADIAVKLGKHPMVLDAPFQSLVALEDGHGIA